MEEKQRVLLFSQTLIQTSVDGIVPLYSVRMCPMKKANGKNTVGVGCSVTT